MARFSVLIAKRMGLPEDMVDTSGPLPSVPSGGDLLPKGAGGLPDPPSLPGQVLGRGLP